MEPLGISSTQNRSIWRGTNRKLVAILPGYLKEVGSSLLPSPIGPKYLYSIRM